MFILTLLQGLDFPFLLLLVADVFAAPVLIVIRRFGLWVWRNLRFSQFQLRSTCCGSTLFFLVSFHLSSFANASFITPLLALPKARRKRGRTRCKQECQNRVRKGSLTPKATSLVLPFLDTLMIKRPIATSTLCPVGMTRGNTSSQHALPCEQRKQIFGSGHFATHARCWTRTSGSQATKHKKRKQKHVSRTVVHHVGVHVCRTEWHAKPHQAGIL